MQRDQSDERRIACRYNPTEPGEYRVHVKWSGIDVPRSPFTVRIDSQRKELWK